MFNAKVVVITGGGSGIGSALSRAFAREGAKVCVADIDKSAADSVAKEFSGLAVDCDVSKEAQINELVAKVERILGPIDIFCSNAGFAKGEPSHAASADNSIWQMNWDVHVMAHVYASRAVLPSMIARKSGCLVQVASAAGLLNQIGDAAYSASKSAAVSFAQSLAITHADDGIDVSVVCPQYVATPLLDMNDDTLLTDSLISADDVANVVLQGLREKTFMILPHPAVSEFVSLKAENLPRWLSGMRALRRKFLRDSKSGDLKDLHRFL